MKFVIILSAVRGSILVKFCDNRLKVCFRLKQNIGYKLVNFLSIQLTRK